MQPKALKLLEDVRDSSAFIQELATERTLEDYLADRQFRLAVERSFEIIGEALRRLTKLDSAIADHVGECARIIAFRKAQSWLRPRR